MYSMTQLELLARLENWYASQCDGEWEHHRGVIIETLDNPGWRLKADVSQTFETKTILSNQNSDSDWIHCEVKDGEFLGAGDPEKLANIIEAFLKFVGEAD